MGGCIGSEEEEETASWASLLERTPVRRVNWEETGWREYLEWKVKTLSLAVLIVIVDRNSSGC